MKKFWSTLQYSITPDILFNPCSESYLYHFHGLYFSNLMVVWWILIDMLMAPVARAFISAFEIFNQTGAFGNSFVFFMAGVATTLKLDLYGIALECDMASDSYSTSNSYFRLFV